VVWVLDPALPLVAADKLTQFAHLLKEHIQDGCSSMSLPAALPSRSEVWDDVVIYLDQ
jgi:hypothetical protein